METTEIGELLLAGECELRRYAFRLTFDVDKANDLWQETAMRVLYNADKFIAGSDFQKWARVVMRNVFLNNVKYETRYSPTDDIFISAPSLLITPAVWCSDTSINLNEIYDAVDSLPGNGSRLIRLLILGHRYAEIAVMTELPLGTVKNRICLSRAELKRRLKDFLS